MKKLFTDMSIPAVKMSMKYHIGKLYKKGLLKANYSSHDLRHFFAVREYAKDKDIWRVSRLLNHSSLGSTEKYLKGLDRTM